MDENFLLKLAPPEEVEKDEDEPELPSYSDVGFILVKVGPYLEPEFSWRDKHEYEVLDHSGCTYWIAEGTGIDYWLNANIEFPKEGGVFVLEGITGRYIKGEWGFTDDDEEFTYESMRPATEEEIKNGTVDYKPHYGADVPDILAEALIKDIEASKNE